MKLTDSEMYFAKRAIKRKKLFLVLSFASIFIAFCLAAYYTWQAFTQSDFGIAIHFVPVLLILLMARQNLRQYYYAKILEKLIA